MASFLKTKILWEKRLFFITQADLLDFCTPILLKNP